MLTAPPESTLCLLSPNPLTQSLPPVQPTPLDSYLPWHLFRFMSVRRIMTNHLTSCHVCVTASVRVCVCVTFYAPHVSTLVLGVPGPPVVIVGVARWATRRIRNASASPRHAPSPPLRVCLFICSFSMVVVFIVICLHN